jgi:hypothetical protein
MNLDGLQWSRSGARTSYGQIAGKSRAEESYPATEAPRHAYGRRREPRGDYHRCKSRPSARSGNSWHEYMGHANRVSSPELLGILVPRVGLTDLAGLRPRRTSNVSDVLAGRLPTDDESAAGRLRRVSAVARPSSIPRILATPGRGSPGA